MDVAVTTRIRSAQQRHVIDDSSKVGEARRAAQTLASFEFNADIAGKVTIAATELANNPKSHIANNLEGFAKLAFGCPAGGELGFDDLLVAVGAADLAARMQARLPPIREALAAIPGDDFREALTANPAQVQAVYEQLRQLIVLMKTEFVSVLNLELPKGIQSDQD